MHKNPYSWITGLMILGVSAILGLQTYNLIGLYHQKIAEFEARVYPAMERIADRLRDQQNLGILQNQIIVGRGDSIVRIGSEIHISDKSDFSKRNVSKKISFSDSTENDGKRIVIRQIQRTSSFSGKKDLIQVKTLDELEGKFGQIRLNIGGKPGGPLLSQSYLDSLKATTDEMTALIREIQIEKIIGAIDSISSDSLSQIIKSALAGKGIFNQFNFSLRNTSKSKNIILNQSEGFDESSEYYQADLAANRLLKTGDVLYLQFPGLNKFAIKGIAGHFVLSLAFSVLIIMIFAFTLGLVFRQKKISEMKADFVNNMTHELKTPIATISLAVDAMRNPLLKDDTIRLNEYHGILKEETSKLNRHVERVLQTSMLEQGKFNRKNEIVDLRELILNCIADLKLRIEEHKAKLNLKCEVKMSVSGDPQMLKSVFQNLLDNALKYSAEGVQIEIAVDEQTVGDKKYRQIRIKDNGIGIHTKHHARIFEKFFRIQNGDLHDVKGFGLGLSQVKSIVEFHGGTVRLESELSVGTTFIILLPAYE